MRRKYISFSTEDAKKLAKENEELLTKGYVKTEGFEKTIVFLLSLVQTIWQIAQKHKSFRMELFYDAETLNTNYCFFVPNQKSESNGTNSEFSND